MICPNCATENRPGRKFCVQCATPLELAYGGTVEKFIGDAAASTATPG